MIGGHLRATLSELQEEFDSAMGDHRDAHGEEAHKALTDDLEQHHAAALAAVRGGPEAKIVDPARVWGHTLRGHAGEELIGALDKHAIVKGDGSIVGVAKYLQMDPRWSLAFMKFLRYRRHKAPFATDPQTIALPNVVNLALVGDWGTGYWRGAETPAARVAEQVGRVGADYTIHLGDVYYAGTEDEEQQNFVDIWPRGRHGQLALNSNHEMYCGGRNYYAALDKLFPLQKGTSYFAMHNERWLILGLDTAYLATDMYLHGALGTDNAQTRWLRELGERFSNRRVIALSHHLPYELEGDKTRRTFDEFRAAFGRVPDYWYWGHAHNVVVYRGLADRMRGRCIGHGSIPYGHANELKAKANVEWYETETAGDPEYPNRVLCGFAQVRLSGADLEERLIGEDGSVRWSP